ncbi:trehalose 6-phosphatase [Flavimobilis soli]|uniref:Trehalose 6-phosphate phosphatase n=1 Tax=Flavimobilis soli TaxID=442709 RepID=A0A2A9EGJ2_9MICO|nr:trehalose-phosphatase [Flavimobilis soli]PFG37352.1 trehalose 6-phosphatase [Flavimobilis soli]
MPDPALALPDDLETALARLAGGAGASPEAADGPVLVASDFDGVVARLVDKPDESRPTASAGAALARLAAGSPDRVRLALVSGRRLDDLARVSRVPAGTLLVGSHGAEQGRVTGEGLEHTPVALSADEADRLENLTTAFEEVAGTAEGAWVEHKPTAAVLHVRLAGPEDTVRATAEAVAASESLGLPPMRGKDVVETGVVATSKGQALEALRAETGARAVFYMGDDVTDERAFAVLHDGDVSVRVGPGETVARHRVADPDEAALVLTRLADLLTGASAPG